ncbi:MAG: 5'/3'-nucleotidase SurE [Anaerolineaceae bacterium 4572_78]|nr:MAG: 5'/3'-nucleotidase SurE [Anaerolineaceae bacterium 4572_78]
MNKPLILITNDDGIQSPGLLATAEALAPIGDLLIVAPHEQQTGTGRSFSKITDRQIYTHSLIVNGQTMTAYSIKSTPAQVVAIALNGLTLRPVTLTVSGINYGLNVGVYTTSSGTIGAALESAVQGVPALAVSLETTPKYCYSHSDDVDFGVAAYFTHYFTERMLRNLPLPHDVDVLKVDIPATATEQTTWQATCVSRKARWRNSSVSKSIWKSIPEDYQLVDNVEGVEPISDTQTTVVDKCISVTPLSVDITSRIPLEHVRALLS